MNVFKNFLTAWSLKLKLLMYFSSVDIIMLKCMDDAALQCFVHCKVIHTKTRRCGVCLILLTVSI